MDGKAIVALCCRVAPVASSVGLVVVFFIRVSGNDTHRGRKQFGVGNEQDPIGSCDLGRGGTDRRDHSVDVLGGYRITNAEHLAESTSCREFARDLTATEPGKKCSAEADTEEEGRDDDGDDGRVDAQLVRCDDGGERKNSELAPEGTRCRSIGDA